MSSIARVRLPDIVGRLALTCSSLMPHGADMVTQLKR